MNLGAREVGIRGAAVKQRREGYKLCRGQQGVTFYPCPWLYLSLFGLIGNC